MSRKGTHTGNQIRNAVNSSNVLFLMSTWWLLLLLLLVSSSSKRCKTLKPSQRIEFCGVGIRGRDEGAKDAKEQRRGKGSSCLTGGLVRH